MPVDQAIVRRLLAIVRRNHAILEKYRQLPAADFASDEGRILAVEHGLQIMIQALIDISLHICAAMQAGKIEMYRDAPRGLLRLGLLTPEQAKTLEQMTGLRNLLVHGYANIAEERILEFLRNHLDDFTTLADTLESTLRN